MDKLIRDPLWNTIRLDDTAVRIVDTAVFQRLRRIRQLGLAYLVYPGASHTRFDHALGVYHLAGRAVALLGERGALATVDPLDCRLVQYAALLHDIGHYPFSHALEELDAARVPAHHEALTGRFLADPELRAVLATVSSDAAERIDRLIRGVSDSPLQGLVSGSLDLDKIEYLNRDASFCGVPYGVVDMDRLVHALAIVPDPVTGRLEIGVHEKGLSALESLLFAKYQMFRNVYWHHAVRSATAVYKRLVLESLDGALVRPDELVGRSDEGMLALLEARAEERLRAGDDYVARAVRERWLPAIRDRRLPKRALEVPGEMLRDTPLSTWFYDDEALVREIEDRLAREMDLPRGGVFLDYPEKPRMMGLDILLLHRDGTARRLTETGRAGLIDLPRVSEELYHTARVFRVFTAQRREMRSARFVETLALSPEEIRARLAGSEPFL